MWIIKSSLLVFTQYRLEFTKRLVLRYFRLVYSSKFYQNNSRQIFRKFYRNVMNIIRISSNYFSQCCLIKEQGQADFLIASSVSNATVIEIEHPADEFCVQRLFASRPKTLAFTRSFCRFTLEGICSWHCAISVYCQMSHVNMEKSHGDSVVWYRIPTLSAFSL